MKIQTKSLIATSLIILAIGGIVFYFAASSPPIPDDIKQRAGFSLYYPSSLPAGYSLDKDTVNGQNGFVFYTLRNGDKQITISQQKAPPKPPDLSILAGSKGSFDKVEGVAGNAVVGTTDASLPTAIYLTNTTLINVNGSSSNIPSEVLVDVLKNLHSLPQN